MVNFNANNPSKEVVFVFLDRISSCNTAWTAELMKNLSDFVITNILDKGYNVIQGIDEDDCLLEAAKNYSYAVVLSTGTEFINGDSFFVEVEKLIQSELDFFLMGHIPDRDDGYYELHEQCYIINLSTYKELNYPAVGNFAYYSSHTQVEPLRAEENIHDDYTPVWVEPGNVTKEYKHKWHGWNILSEAFRRNKSVLVFGPEFRDSKRFYYPNYEPSFIPASTYLYGKQQVAAQTLFYPYNTEMFQEIIFTGPIKQLVIQASGLQFVDYLKKYGYDNNTVVRFVDYNLFALECMNEIVTKWNGDDEYLNFVNEYVNRRSQFLRSKYKEWITLTGTLQDINTEIWQDIVNTVTFEFCHEDLVLNKGLDVEAWVDRVPNTIIHLSHIFNYDPVSTFYPLSHRRYSEELLMKKLKGHVPDATIVLTSKVSDWTIRPTWHMNGDW